MARRDAGQMPTKVPPPRLFGPEMRHLEARRSCRRARGPKLLDRRSKITARHDFRDAWAGGFLTHCRFTASRVRLSCSECSLSPISSDSLVPEVRRGDVSDLSRLCCRIASAEGLPLFGKCRGAHRMNIAPLEEKHCTALADIVPKLLDFARDRSTSPQNSGIAGKWWSSPTSLKIGPSPDRNRKTPASSQNCSISHDIGQPSPPGLAEVAGNWRGVARASCRGPRICQPRARVVAIRSARRPSGGRRL